MIDQLDYLSKNRDLWNKRTNVHVDSKFYDMKNFMAGKISLKEIELDLLGEFRGKSILHLQCHFGQDTLSLARLGAKVTGVDLSDQAIAKAKSLTEELRLPAEFICCDLYSLPQHLNEQFDLVFTSYGTIGWLPDLNRWAKLVANYLKPGGKFVFVEFHPVIWMFDNQLQEISYSYFNTGPIVETEQGSYADRNANLKTESISWNHPTSEVINSLVAAGLQIQSFNEYDYSPYACFQNVVEFSPGRFRFKHLGSKIPMVFSLTAIK